MATRPLLFTRFGALLSVIAVGAWIATFEPHGGASLSSELYPLLRLTANQFCRERSVPMLAWYAAALLHWPAVGALIDCGRALRRRNRRMDSPRDQSTRAASRVASHPRNQEQA